MSFDPLKRSPLLQKLSRDATPLRMEQLTTKALGIEKPIRPKSNECCGSSCDPCVMTLYAQELKVWKECHDPKWDMGIQLDEKENICDSDTIVEQKLIKTNLDW
ncbi:hypothetical protein BC833DRAFT_613647 [Globomyces pollinis-pini]|nr:hypothetical protein BC833DRAFT_613647 [Globomyces pollinis-pini]